MAKAAAIYLIEDDESIRELVLYALESAGYAVRGFADGGQFWQALAEGETPGLILLDIMLPGEDGLTILRRLKASARLSDTPVIMLTAKAAEYDKVRGLDLGADDYVTKPFDIKEVTARVEVQIRRAETTGRKEEEHRFTYQELELNKGDFTVKVGNTELPHITKQEFSILELLLKHPKKVFSKEEMFEYAWEEQYMGETKTLDVHISNIRKKIKAVTDKEYIETVWGIGYRLHP